MSNYSNTLNAAMSWGKEQHPQSSQQHHAAFANSVAYAIYRAAGGFGGPSIREYAASKATNESGIDWQSTPIEEVYKFVDPIVYGPITDLHRNIWESARARCQDNDPADVRALENYRIN